MQKKKKCVRMSSETVDDDDNMIIFYVGDEEQSEDGDEGIQVPYPVSVKIEPVEDSSEGAGSQSEIEVSPTQTENNVVRTEDHHKDEYEVEYLDEDNIKGELEDSEEYEIEYLEDYETLEEYNEEPAIDNQDEYTSDEEIVSYVDQLREQFPGRSKDQQWLVNQLVSVMRKMKPPKPPPNFCKINIVAGDKVVYKCSYCPKEHGTMAWAARHYQFTHGENYLTCYACGTQYRNTTNLYKHEKRCQAPDARLVLRARGHYLGCKGRGRPYTTFTRFITANTPTAKEKRRFYCSKCPASFAHRENFEAHENAHAGLRPFHCNHCNAKYTSKQSLVRHEKALHGTERFICDICGAIFPLKPLIVSHMDSHRSVLKHPCSYCERRFSQKSALRHHTNKVHLQLPPEHGCPVCPKRYARMSHVRDHMSKAHGLNMITRRMYLTTMPVMEEPLNGRLDGKVIFNTYQQPKQDLDEIVIEEDEAIQDETIADSNQTIKKESEEINFLIHDTPNINLKEYIELDLRDNADSGDFFIKHVIVEDGESQADTKYSKKRRGQKKITKNLSETNISKETKRNAFNAHVIIDKVSNTKTNTKKHIKKKKNVKTKQKGIEEIVDDSEETTTAIAEIVQDTEISQETQEAISELTVPDVKSAEEDMEKETVTPEISTHENEEIVKGPEEALTTVTEAVQYSEISQARQEDNYILPEIISTHEDDMYKIERDIKSSLRKHEKIEQPGTSSQEKEKNTENETASAKRVTEDKLSEVSKEDAEDWKEDKKHQVVAEFLEYMKSGKPKSSKNVLCKTRMQRNTINSVDIENTPNDDDKSKADTENEVVEEASKEGTAIKPDDVKTSESETPVKPEDEKVSKVVTRSKARVASNIVTRNKANVKPSIVETRSQRRGLKRQGDQMKELSRLEILNKKK